MAAAEARTNVLKMYKNLMKMAKGLPEAKREQSLRTIREDFRKNVGELNPDRVSEMLVKANSTLGSTALRLMYSDKYVQYGHSQHYISSRIFENCHSEIDEKTRRIHHNCLWHS